jgi:hypothetical protein
VADATAGKLTPPRAVTTNAKVGVARLGVADLKRAVILQEVLGPPVSARQGGKL